MPYNRTSPDHSLAQRQFPAQKRALTIAIKSGDPAKVIAAATKAVKQWDETGTWPDAWHNWNIALDDAYNLHRQQFITGARSDKPYSNDYELEELRNR